MNVVAYLSQRRRVLALSAATVALHIIAINWISARVGLMDDSRKPEPSVVQAELRLAPSQPASATEPEPAPTPPQPEPAPKAPPAADTPPPAASEAPAAADADSAPPPVEPAPSPASPADQAGAAPTPSEAPAAQPGPDQVESAPPTAGRRYKVKLPPPASFELDVKRKDADGTNWSGSATMFWDTDGTRYTAGLDVGITVIFRVNLLTLRSEGLIDDAGIAPVKMTEKRRSRSETATHFNYEDKRITFSASDKSQPLMAGVQDKATVPFQLAAIGRADINQFASDIDMLVGEDRGATIYRFQLVGEEELETAMGKLVTLRLARPPRPGSYNARLDVWLAPSLGWFPVQIRNTEGNGAVTTQTVTKIKHADGSAK